VTLTERGRACIAASVEVIAGLERRLEELLGSEQLTTVQDALGRILRHEW
jgi:DNA-binding MarR family transcriptional regulator